MTRTTSKREISRLVSQCTGFVPANAGGSGSQFTGRYKTKKLVYVAEFESIHQAIEWEKTIKAGSRQKKIDLIEEQNPEWMDLSETF
jgi:predicted GIY-YIG superfamily endonuclease